MSSKNTQIMNKSDKQALFNKNLAYITNQVRVLYFNLSLTYYCQHHGYHLNYNLYNEFCIQKLKTFFNSKFGKYLITNNYIRPISKYENHQYLVKKYYLNLDDLNCRVHNPFYSRQIITSLMGMYYYLITFDGKLRGSLYSLDMHNDTQCQFAKQGAYREYIDFEKIVLSHMGQILIRKAKKHPLVLPLHSLPRIVRINNKEDKKYFDLDFKTVDMLRKNYANTILNYVRNYLRQTLLVSVDNTLQSMIKEVENYENKPNKSSYIQNVKIICNQFKQLFNIPSNNYFLIIFNDVPPLTKYFSKSYVPHTLHDVLVMLREYQHYCSLSELPKAKSKDVVQDVKAPKKKNNSKKALTLAKKLVQVEKDQLELNSVRKSILKQLNDLDG